ncbi:uncharacterized protein LOC129569037 isoform X1 [Sitodiplosis mosellana]|uniref:uncharacterized protein LOC129569037 isoform X1 n=1 Tax=Sitodiplosis mosellana TaxID=263140 RepID=UPI00244502DF|nr:uncharacterized protein LOC129569037 isoform X1 [Sitodiplosis mosellana]
MDLQIQLKQLQENYHRNPNNKHIKENIIHLRDIYSKVWLIKNRFSSCFGWSFITFAMDYCFDFINSSYWGYVTIKTYKSTLKTIHVLYYLISINLNFWYLCMISERCQNAGKGVANALHTPSNYQDPQYQRFIRIFSIQLWKQPIQIKIKQMFTINYALLKSAIVLITTYIAIVIQFQIAEENASSLLKNI